MTFFESIFYMAWRGVAIGLIISAPMGPVGMLCIQRTLDKGRRAGFYTGLGAALSDLFYALLTGFGLSFIEEFLERNSNIIQLAGSAVLIGFGIYLFKKNPTKSLRKPIDEEVSVKKNILGGFLFTFSNPLILFLIVGLFARFNFLLPEFKLHQYLTGFIFIFAGAILWWWFITFSISKVRNHFNIRSMWLINRIIGTIILLFAVVGIITATTALVKGNDKTTLPSELQKLEGHIFNNTTDTLHLLLPADAADGLEFRLKVKNHKPGNGKDWGLMIAGTRGERVSIEISPGETESDGISTRPGLRLKPTINGRQGESLLKTDDKNIVQKIKGTAAGPDPTGALNFFKATLFRDRLSLSGGLHAPERLLELELTGDFRADSVGIWLSPGTELTLSETRLETTRFYDDHIIWDDQEMLEDYLKSSRDHMEGIVRILDRSLEESLLRTGGDYRLAIVRAEDGYDLIYLGGAVINADYWTPGMIKGHLSPSGIKGVWNVEWIDAMHRPMSHELKAQRDENGTITIQFPYQNSQIRLHPEDN